MTAIGQDSLGTRDTLTAGGKSYDYFSLPKAAAKLGDISRLPFSMKVLLENLLRFEDGKTVTTDDIQAVIDWQNNPKAPEREIQYRPARVLMQDFTSIWRRCVTRSPGWAAMPRASTRWCRCIW